jgi:hypothetical protein
VILTIAPELIITFIIQPNPDFREKEENDEFIKIISPSLFVSEINEEERRIHSSLSLGEKEQLININELVNRKKEEESELGKIN